MRRVPIFAGLAADQQDAVASFARPTRLARGELLHLAGDDVGRLFVVHTGSVKLVRVAPSGRERLLRLAEPGDVVGEHSFLTGEAPEYYAEATEDAQLCVFRHADLAGLVAEFPAIALEMMRSLSARLADSERLLGLGAADVPARLAAYLLTLPYLPGPGTRVRLPLAKKDVASYLGTTPESLSRALTRLQQSGAVTPSGETLTLDVEFLEALADEA